MLPGSLAAWVVEENTSGLVITTGNAGLTLDTPVGEPPHLFPGRAATGPRYELTNTGDVPLALSATVMSGTQTSTESILGSSTAVGLKVIPADASCSGEDAFSSVSAEPPTFLGSIAAGSTLSVCTRFSLVSETPQSAQGEDAPNFIISLTGLQMPG
jgi:hypothetical protein